MNIKKFLTTKLMAEAAGKNIIEIVKKKHDSLLCFAGGDTPLMTLNYLVEAANRGKLTLEHARLSVLMNGLVLIKKRMEVVSKHYLIIFLIVSQI